MPGTNGEPSNLEAADDGKKVATVDKPVTVVTTSGDYQGSINLNLANVHVNRVSDLFIKTDIAFLPLYNAIVMGHRGKEVLINIKDIAVVIPHDQISAPSPALRKDAAVSVKLKYSLGQLTGNVNLWGETQEVDRISDLLNFPDKKWLTLYDVSFKGKQLPAAIINLQFISLVED
jgi:hypothetical protein